MSGWPTIPQVFVGGELIGGADICEELLASGWSWNASSTTRWGLTALATRTLALVWNGRRPQTQPAQRGWEYPWA